MKWCFLKGWVGEIHLSDSSEEVAQVLSGKMTATDYFLKFCDGKLTDEDLNAEGNSFAEIYYGDDGLYFEDYMSLFDEKLYVSSETNHDYERFSDLLEIRYLSKKWVQ